MADELTAATSVKQGTTHRMFFFSFPLQDFCLTGLAVCSCYAWWSEEGQDQGSPSMWSALDIDVECNSHQPCSFTITLGLIKLISSLQRTGARRDYTKYGKTKTQKEDTVKTMDVRDGPPTFSSYNTVPHIFQKGGFWYVWHCSVACESRMPVTITTESKRWMHWMSVTT